MTSNELDRIQSTQAAPVPDFLGQGTAVEQSRAVAEVQAAVVIARQYPRNVQAALSEMREVCRIKGLAERAFYSYPKAGSTVSGPSVHLARELARIWGNVQYTTAELRRDDDRAFSEMQAVAWDLQTNTRAAQIHVVPHKMDTKKGVKVLTDMRDVYENNANMGARRLRAAIFAILPAWFKDEAIDLCQATLRDGGGKPLVHRIAAIVELFATTFDVSQEQLAENRGKPTDKWTEHDLAQMTILGRSLKNGEISKDEAFPSLTAPVSLAELQQPAKRSAARPARQEPTPEPVPPAQDPEGFDPTLDPNWGKQ
jgi:hypothetical protein